MLADRGNRRARVELARRDAPVAAQPVVPRFRRAYGLERLGREIDRVPFRDELPEHRGVEQRVGMAVELGFLHPGGPILPPSPLPIFRLPVQSSAAHPPARRPSGVTSVPVADPERTDAEAFHEALRHPPAMRDLGRLALRLSLFALADLFVTFLLLLSFDRPSSRGSVADGVLAIGFLACLLLSAAGGLLGLFALFRPGARVLKCVGAILLGMLAWPIALVLAFIAVGGAGAPGRAMRVGGVRVLPRVVRGRGKRVRRAFSEYEPDSDARAGEDAPAAGDALAGGCPRGARIR